MDFTMRRVMQHKNTMLLKEKHIKLLMYQILFGLYHAQQSQLVCEDLCPREIFVSSNLRELCLSTNILQKVGYITDHDKSDRRFYRGCVSLLDGDQVNTNAGAIWQCGCLLAHLFTRLPHTPVFPPLTSNSPFNQLRAFLTVVGTPSEEDMEQIENPDVREIVCDKFMDVPRVYFQEIFCVPPEGAPLSDDAADLLERMFQYNPKKRISVIEALRHTYFKEFHNIEMDLGEKDRCSTTTTTPFVFDEESLMKLCCASAIRHAICDCVRDIHDLSSHEVF
jgi:serine/threonine protein kinase